MSAYNIMLVEIVGMGQCNLRCPSCPVGNMREIHNPMGMMQPDLLEKIVVKAVGELGIETFALYNWGEPTIHPKIAELITVVQRNGGHAQLSSNLNFGADFHAIMTANPHTLRVSCSGFSQSTYEVGHRGGDVEIVKKHMRELMEAKTATGATTEVHMLFHRYKNNLDDEALMHAYCESLGIRFVPVWAYFMPLEKGLAFAESGRNSPKLSDEDRAVIDRLAIPLDAAYAAAKQYSENPCKLKDNQLVLDFQGNAVLCCAVYDTKANMVGNFLETPVEQIQAMRNTHPTCGPCMKSGNHMLSVYAVPEVDRMAAERTLMHYAAQMNLNVRVRN